MQDIEVIGKSAPILNQLRNAEDMDVDSIELYLTREHLDNYKKTVSNCTESSLDIECVHTPHIPLDERELLDKSVELAEDLESDLMCLHSGEITTTNMIKYGNELQTEVTTGAEMHQYTDIGLFINECKLNNIPIVLDIAHVFMAEASHNNYKNIVNKILESNEYPVSLIHFNDGTFDNDGLPINEGEIDLEWTINQINENYTGYLTVEVPPENQKNDIKWVKDRIN